MDSTPQDQGAPAGPERTILTHDNIVNGYCHLIDGTKVWFDHMGQCLQDLAEEVIAEHATLRGFGTATTTEPVQGLPSDPNAPAGPGAGAAAPTTPPAEHLAAVKRMVDDVREWAKTERTTMKSEMADLGKSIIADAKKEAGRIIDEAKKSIPGLVAAEIAKLKAAKVDAPAKPAAAPAKPEVSDAAKTDAAKTDAAKTDAAKTDAAKTA